MPRDIFARRSRHRCNHCFVLVYAISRSMHQRKRLTVNYRASMLVSRRHEFINYIDNNSVLGSGTGESHAKESIDSTGVFFICCEWPRDTCIKKKKNGDGAIDTCRPIDLPCPLRGEIRLCSSARVFFFAIPEQFLSLLLSDNFNGNAN